MAKGNTAWWMDEGYERAIALHSQITNSTQWNAVIGIVPKINIAIRNVSKIQMAVFSCLERNYSDICKQCHTINQETVHNMELEDSEESIELTPSMVELCNCYIATQYKKDLCIDRGELSKAELTKITRFCERFYSFFIDADSIFEKAVMAFIADISSSSVSGISLPALNYYKLAESVGSNRLARALAINTTNAQLDFYGNAVIKDKRNDIKLFVEGYSELARKPQQSAAMLLDILMIKATMSGLNNTLMRLPLKEYMSMRGLTDEKSARTQAKADLETLYRVSFEYKGPKPVRGKTPWLKVRLADVVGEPSNGVLVFRFSEGFYESFKAGGASSSAQFMYFPREALQGSIHANPWKYWLARKIAEHKRINLGKPNEDIISVRTLIDACPNYPTYDTVMSGGAHVQQLIIDPFERDMDTFTTFTWNYAGEQPQNYNSFIESYVQITWHNYPDVSGLVKTRERYQKQSANRQKKKANPNRIVS